MSCSWSSDERTISFIFIFFVGADCFHFFILHKFIVHHDHYLQCLLLLRMEFDVSSRTSSDASDDASDDNSTGSDLSLAEVICIASLALSSRANRLVVKRINWHLHTQSLLHENLFHVKYRMSLESFNKLLDLLSPHLQLKDKSTNTILCQSCVCH